MGPRVNPFAACSVFCLPSLIPLGKTSKRSGCLQSCTLGCPGSPAGRGGCPLQSRKGLTVLSFCFNMDLRRFNNGKGYRAQLEHLPFTGTPLQTKPNTPLAEEAA